MIKPSYADGRKCIQIRRRSKRGEYVSSEDHKFCRSMFEKFDDWYAKTEAIVFNLTVPFGSQTRQAVDPEVQEYIGI